MSSTCGAPCKIGGAQRGFSLIEVLVTLFIISLALLGTAGLQAYSMRLNQSGQLRTQAVFLAADLAERIEANKSGAVGGEYAVAASSTANTLNTACATAVCTPTQLKDYDISQWQNAVAAALPQASWQVCVDADLDNTCDASPVAANPISYLIIINWVDRRVDTTYSASGTGETFSYRATRTVFSN